MTFAFGSGADIALWMLFSLLVSVAVIGAAMAAHDVQRTANRPVRWVWTTAILAIVVLSVAAPFRAPSASNTVLPVASKTALVLTDSVAAAPATWQWLTTARSAFVTPLRATLARANQSLRRAPAYTGVVLATSWAMASLAVTLMLVLSYRRMVRHVQQFPKSTIDGVAVRLSSGVGPAVVGLAPSEIVVPAWLTSRSLPEQRMVVTHEAEHIRASDPWVLAAACVAVAIMPWNAALWYALSRLRLAIEIDCDRRVLQRGVHAETYGSLLIDLTAVRPLLPIAMPAFPGTHSHLERRILAMTQQPARFITARRIASALVATAVFVTACESTLPTAAEVETMDVASAEKQAMKAGLVDTAHVAYFVDGQEIEEQKAKALLSSDIASVKVSKARNGGVNQVHIATKDNDIIGDTIYAVGFDKSDVLEIRQKPANDAKPQGSVLFRKTPDADPTGSPLIVIDGIISQSQSLQTLELSKNRIESVEVVKGAAATKLYTDPRAANGVIIVKTKK